VRYSPFSSMEPASPFPLIPWDVLGMIIERMDYKSVCKSAFVSVRWFGFCKKAIGCQVVLIDLEVEGPAKINIVGLEVSLKCWCSPNGMDRTVSVGSEKGTDTIVCRSLMVKLFQTKR
jgi:hypothetical protein